MSSGLRKNSSTPSVGTAKSTKLVHPTPRGRQELAISPILPLFRYTANISSFEFSGSTGNPDENPRNSRHQYRSDAVAGIQYEFEAEAFGAGREKVRNTKKKRGSPVTFYKRGFEPYKMLNGGSTLPRAAKSRKTSVVSQNSNGNKCSSLSLQGKPSLKCESGRRCGKVLEDDSANNFKSNSWAFNSRNAANNLAVTNAKIAPMVVSDFPKRNACSSPVVNPYRPEMFVYKRPRPFIFDDLPDDVVNTSIFSGFLNSLDVIRSLVLTCKRFRRLARTGVRLLDLNNTQITDDALERLVNNFPYIQDLNLSHCSRLSSSCEQHIGKLNHLHSLVIKSSGITTSFFYRVHENWSKSCKENLNMLDMSCISGAGFAACDVVFQSFCNLKIFKASNLKMDNSRNNSDALSTYGKIAKLKNLTELDVSCNPSMDGEKLMRAILCTSFAGKLKSIDLHGCMHAGSADLFLCISRLTKLKYLNLGFLGTAPADLFHPLGNLSDLIYLNLSYTSIDDKFLERLKKLKHLKSLNIGGCRSVSDDGLATIASYLQNLEVLDCCGLHAITEGGMQVLGGLPKLKYLNVQFCNPEATGKVKKYFKSLNKAVVILD